MARITFLLQNTQGDELGRLHLPDVQVADASRPGTTTVRPDLGGQMAQFSSRLMAVLAREGMEPAGDAASVKIALARGLLSPAWDDKQGEETVTIPLPVRAAGPSQNPTPSTARLPDALADRKSTGLYTQDSPLGVPSGTVSSRPSEPEAPLRLSDTSGDDEWDDLFTLRTENFDAERRNSNSRDTPLAVQLPPSRRAGAKQNKRALPDMPPMSTWDEFEDDFE